ncbi:MAG: hypothetical protein A3E07_03575 [Candidatus Wildermuthbacteria bacterium RIFCSPHIGHO2_12_FULL_45_9]|uniref:Peptidase M50 domain-containing protein n=1 Tax=Candidatus Wildermuthbacteria bacterium RIFCSPHIGHO2_02_FULL_45_25 TaxID=1802450 RepID=A0A1G2R4Y6_9BACT|nr:MAG: hypothetical protein A2748_03205 [Candidatus Wildermuthbacteria bacterium RIFCSPHIGHO2_01_FULL_45_20]OHA67924.1 MAG: hypothetical protein A3C04_04600 [Candidatus Wildermuthbacteria bacterium RIFCSPHIGHO2_02_FULL_45_25]OHA72289.1 MAG: hypothetical protein A3E07_03575 [Candidatus Wildermuthbacteria bacterium RIFCSPHIGHO2_12_FULL_45_9]
MPDFFEFFILLILLLPSVVLHEVSHGLVANMLGDPTARNAGRLTLNPISHVDVVGSFIVPLTFFFATGGFFGWAKPVPVNPSNLRGKYASALVSIAGPASNFAIAIVFAAFTRIALQLDAVNENFVQILVWIVLVNVTLGLFNLLPLPPLDGSHILFTFLPTSLEHMKVFLLQYGMFLVMGLILLNLVLNGAVLDIFFKGIERPLVDFLVGVP